MTYTEKSIQCSDCGKSFPFTTEEQEFFATKGFTNEPKRCFPCRSARRAEKFGNDSGSSNHGSRQMYPVTCGRCGKQTEVPFQPRGDKPVYCRECFNQSK
jgi:CxxC-x17-CxxC domain-containing protein